MDKETRTCQNCKKSFSIEPEDFDFYERIQVPPPTFCPECRLQRRMTWRNERTLYHSKCRATGKSVIAMFSPDSPIIVYDHNYWWSDNWDQLASGRDYDFNKPFFVQFKELLESAPLPNLANTNVVNSDYGNHNEGLKNCYLTYASFQNENIHYSSGAVDCKDSLDLYINEKVEQGYDNALCNGSNKIFFSYDTGESINSSFLISCKNLTNCLGCINLRNKSYHIFNQPFSKEDYKKELEKLNLSSYKSLIEFRKKFRSFAAKYPRRFATILKSTGATGDMVINVKNCSNCFDVYDNAEDCKYIIHALNIKDSYDGYGYGAKADFLYEGVDSGIDASHYKFTVYAHGCHNVEYIYSCLFSSKLFGCVGLRNKKYCILNKQYTKEEYEKLLPEIIKHIDDMPYTDKKGRIYKYGEFFPAELSPFAYNESIAQEYFPTTKEEAEKNGYDWKEAKEKNYKVTLKPEELPDHIKDAKDNIINETIGCEHQEKCNEQCAGAFKIIPEELSFYRQFNLPIPRLCPNCRHYARLKQRNPFKLWRRKCQCAGKKSESGEYENSSSHIHGENHCSNEFETPYSPNKPETIYCESCYQSEFI